MFDVSEVEAGLACIPAGLDEMEPGPVLAAFLAGIDSGMLSGHDRVVVLRARSRLIAHHTAQLYGDMTAIADTADQHLDDPYEAAQSASAEIRLALSLTRRAADTELETAFRLRDRLPRVWDLLAGGHIDVRRARVIADATTHLSDDALDPVMDRIVEEAPRLTTGQLRARLRRLCIDTDPHDAQHRYETRLQERRIISEPTESGTAHLLGFDLPPHRVAAAMDRINRLARTLNTAGETRTMDQLRADVYLDLLTGKASDGAGGSVHIRVDLDTLTRLAEHPGDLGGYGPVIADIARQVTNQQNRAPWRWTVTDPATERPLHNGLTRRRPTPTQRRNVLTQSDTCIFPGCRMPGDACDLDHHTPWAQGGPTNENNLRPLCRHHHRIRHLRGWSYQSLPHGDHQWTTPNGHHYTTTGNRPTRHGLDAKPP